MNVEHATARPGPCEAYEFALAELVDGALAPAQAALVCDHAEGCAPCRGFLERLHAMDRSLAAALPTAQLPADFDARLREHIGRIARATSRDVALARAENDYRSTLRRLQQGRGWRAALDGVAAAGVVAGLWLGLGQWVLAALPALGSLPDLGPAPLPVAGLALAALAIAGGTAATRLMQRTRG